jgi:DNA-binding MarR family transcriptional regulator
MAHEPTRRHPFVAAWRRQLSQEDPAAAEYDVENWFEAVRFRRRLDACLSHLDLNLNQWLVLEGTRQVIAEQRDATSQLQVAERVEMNEMTLSRLMRGLEVRGLVDRSDSFMSPALRILVTKRGEGVLCRARTAIVAQRCT